MRKLTILEAAFRRLVVLVALTADGFTSDAATLAFLVVFRVLIKLFFSMAIMFTRSLQKFVPRPTWPVVQVVCQTGGNRGRLREALKTKELRKRKEPAAGSGRAAIPSPVKN